MGLYRFSFKEKEGEKLGKAQQHDLNCSYKDLSQVLRAIKRKPVEQAREILNAAIELKKAIPFKKFATGMGHRSELGGQRGKYPKKECRIALGLLQNAVANAVAKGLDESALVVKHGAAYKQNVLKRYRKFFATAATLGYGKQAIWSNYTLAWAELAVGEEKQEGKKKGKVEKKIPAAATAKPAVEHTKTKEKTKEEKKTNA
jgi:ribosomal protein uL22